MANPTLPPYFGSWGQLVSELLHNPFLGGGALPGRKPLAEIRTENEDPQPDPWLPATSLMMMAAGLRDLVSHLPEGQKALGAAIGQTVADWDDWFCGTPPHPRPWVIAAAVQLLAIAATMEAGSLRNAVASQATRVLEKSFSGQAPQAGQVTSIAS